MQKETLWGIYTTKNPKWLTEGANLSPAGIKKLVETTYDKAHKQGIANGKALQEKEHQKIKANNPFGEFFNR